MSLGKYSPTVSNAYLMDQDWFEKNSVQSEGSYIEYDSDGFDSYGYNADGKDRAGHTETEYLLDEDLYDYVYDEWDFDPNTGKPSCISSKPLVVKTELRIEKIVIITGRGTDRVSLETKLPSTLRIGNGTLCGNTSLSCEQKAGAGEAWAKQHFPNVPVEIINIKDL